MRNGITWSAKSANWAPGIPKGPIPSQKKMGPKCTTRVRSDDNTPDHNFQVSQRLTSDLTTTPQQCDKEIDNSANRADQQSARHVRSWPQQCKIPSLERKE